MVQTKEQLATKNQKELFRPSLVGVNVRMLGRVENDLLQGYCMDIYGNI